jgi:hypothetical protein
MAYIDSNGLLYLIQKIKMWDRDKVDKVAGKDLSTNDFDNTYKSVLDNLATNYVAAVAGKGLSTNDYDATEKAKVDAAQTAADVLAAIATALGSYSTTTEMNSAIASAINGITGFDFSIVQTLPATGSKGVIYLVGNGGSDNNIYDEYIWITEGEGSGATSKFEKIGTTAVDLTGYVQVTDALTNSQIDTIITTASSGT